MRYTAKARMLSFDFLPDDIVYDLPLVQALLLVGMLARADNLGRLPGEPEVLLTYLFFPKPPRRDISADDVEPLLLKLAQCKRIVWYVMKGVRYIQFSNWDKHQPGIRAHNKRSSYPAPTDDGAGRVALPGDTLALEFEPPPQPPQLSVVELVAGARAQAVATKAQAQFDSDAVMAWVVADTERDALGAYDVLRGVQWVRFAQWLWKTGTTSMRDVLHVLGECRRLRPRSPYAYFIASNGTRGSVEARMNADEAMAEGERIKREERAMFGQ